MSLVLCRNVSMKRIIFKTTISSVFVFPCHNVLPFFDVRDHAPLPRGPEPCSLDVVPFADCVPTASFRLCDAVMSHCMQLTHTFVHASTSGRALPHCDRLFFFDLAVASFFSCPVCSHSWGAPSKTCHFPILVLYEIREVGFLLLLVGAVCSMQYAGCMQEVRVPMVIGWRML